MSVIDRVLVPVDLGPHTEVVLDVATRVATAFGARLRLMYVIEEVPHFPSALDLLRQAAEERLAQFHDSLVARGIPCEPPMPVVGRPYDAIVRNADSANAHLIVMGRGGRGDSDKVGLGTTTSRVMRRSPKPVLTVPPGNPLSLKRILCPVDGSNASARGLRNAIHLAAKLEARLTVMTVITDFAMPLGATRRSPEMAKIASEYEKMEREQFEQFVKGFDFQNVVWDKEVHFGHAADQIVQLATDAKYDMVVMGSTGRSGLPRLLLGSTAEAVARRTPSCMLTVKREDVLTAKVEAELAEIHRLLTEAQHLMDEGLYEEAIGRFDQCLLKNPHLAKAVEGLAVAHERLGHAELAADLHGQAALIRRELYPQTTPEAP